jgi:hypothetical protein
MYVLLIAQETLYWFASNLEHLFLGTGKRTYETRNSARSVLSLIPSEGGSYSCEIKHNRTARRPKLFLLNSILPKQRPQLQKTMLGSIPSKGSCCSLETKHDKRTVPRPKSFVSKRRQQKQMPQPQKLCWVWFRANPVSAVQKLSTTELQCESLSCLFGRGNYGKNITQRSPGFNYWRIWMLLLEKQDQRTMESRLMLFLTENYRNKSHNLEKLYWVQFQEKVVYTAQKLSMTEEWCQDQSCLFQWGAKTIIPKTILSQVLKRVVSVAQKLSITESPSFQQWYHRS